MSSIKSRRSRQTDVGVNSGTDAEAERIWQETTTEEDDNRSIITRAASLERMEVENRVALVIIFKKTMTFRKFKKSFTIYRGINVK